MSIVETIDNEYSCHATSLSTAYGQEAIINFSDRLYRRYCDIFKNADYKLQTEWTLRCFNASKRIATSSLFFVQSDFLLALKCTNLLYNNLYYSLLHAYLAILYQLPQIHFKQIVDRNDNRLYLTHERIFNDIVNYIIRFGLLNDGHKELFSILKLLREIYSYHLPLSGSFMGDNPNSDPHILIQRVQSSITYSYKLSVLISCLGFYAWQRKSPEITDTYEIDQEDVDNGFFSFIEHQDILGTVCLIDNDDYRRQAWALKNLKGPFPLNWIIAEKICEDLECGWASIHNNIPDGFEISNVARFISECID